MDFKFENDKMHNPKFNPLDNNKFAPSKTITVIFDKEDFMNRDNKTIKIECNLDEKVKNVIEKYRLKTYDREPKLKFIYNGMPLNPLSTVAETGLKNNAQILVGYDGGFFG